MEYIFHQMWFYFKHGVERYTYWNLALQDGGVSTWGWSQNSLCTINPVTKELRRNPEFYLMKHFSKYVKKGARYMELKGHFASNSIAFENKDESIVLIVCNSMNKDRELVFAHNNKKCRAIIPAHSLHTFIIQ